MEIWIESLLAALALPKFGLSTVFIVSLISATLLPLGSEPAVFGLVKLDPTLFWPAVGVATVGNTLGGAISWWMGFGAEKAWEQVANRPATEHRALQMLRRGWIVKPVVAFTKNQDIVHRVVGKPGVILVGEGNPVTAGVAGAATSELSLGVTDLPAGELANQSYCVTVAQTGAAANGTILQADIRAWV